MLDAGKAAAPIPASEDALFSAADGANGGEDDNAVEADTPSAARAGWDPKVPTGTGIGTPGKLPIEFTDSRLE